MKDEKEKDFEKIEEEKSPSEEKKEIYCGECRKGMEIIKYIDFFGEEQQIEVSADFLKKYKELLKEEKRIERKETRRCYSLDSLEELGFAFEDREESPVMKSEKRERVKMVCKMIESLLPSQQKLIKQIVFEEKSMAEIAKEEGVDSSAIRHRYRRAKLRMKRWAEKNGGKLLI